MRIFSFLIGITVAVTCALAIEDVDVLPPRWKVSDSWTVLTNVRRQLSQPEITRRERTQAEQIGKQFSELENYWERNVKSKGISYLQWENTEDYQAQGKAVGLLTGAIDNNDPYESWMKSNEDWTMLGKNVLWCRWRFEVLSGEKLLNSDCFKIKVTFVGYRDIDNNDITKNVSGRQSPMAYALIWLRALDGSFAHIEWRKNGDDTIVRNPLGEAKQKDHDASTPRCGHFDFEPYTVAMPFCFPLFLAKEYDPSKEQIALGSLAQRVIPVGERLVFVLAGSLSAIDAINNRLECLPPAYEKQFWRKDLPWWEEAYRYEFGGIRAWLETVNGKEVQVSVSGDQK